MKDYRRFSSLQNSFFVTVAHAQRSREAEVSKQPPEAPPVGATGTRKRSPTLLSRFVEVVVGKHEKLKGWVSPEADLKKIPFLQSLLESEVLSGKVENIKLPDDDPGAFGQVLHFVRYRKMQYDLAALCKHNGGSNPEGKFFYAKSPEMVKTYVLAKKLGVEAVQNAACDQLRNALAYILLTPSEMTHIVDHCDPTDPLFRLSMQALAVNIYKTGWERWRVSNGTWFESFCDQRELNAEVIAEALVQYDSSDYPQTGAGVCQWHTHETTTACEVQELAPEVVIHDKTVLG